MRQALQQGIGVLLHQKCGWSQERNLFTTGDRVGRGANGNFSFTKSDITHDQTVHRNRLLQIILYGFPGGSLIGSEFVRKAQGELVIKSAVNDVGRTGLPRPSASGNQELLGKRGGITLRFTPCFCPQGSTQAMQRWHRLPKIRSHFVRKFDGD